MLPIQVDTNPSLSNSMPMDLLNATEDSSPRMSLSSLACLTSVCSDRLLSCSLWCRRCSLAVALSSRSRCNLSLTLSRFIGVELHGEESSVASISVELDSEGSIVSTCTELLEELQHVYKFEMHMYLCIRFVQVYGHTYIRTYIRNKPTYTRVLQCSPASVGLAQAHPNHPQHSRRG